MQKLFSSLYLTCQPGAEQVLKREMSRDYPELRFSYSRGSFSTWLFDPATFCPLEFQVLTQQSNGRIPSYKPRSDKRFVNTVFGRSCVLSMGKVGGKDAHCDPASLVPALWQLTGDALDVANSTKWFARGIQRIHVWEPDHDKPGKNHFEPRQTPLARDLHRMIAEGCPSEMRKRLKLSQEEIHNTGQAYQGDICLDCIVVRPNEWWLGTHRVVDEHSRWPGGLLPLELPHDAVSRAWLKFEEGLRWSGFPIGLGSRCIDIGSSPGGGSQTLLARGAEVIGVDPAEMAPAVLNHPQFTHARGKINQLKRKLFRKSRWILTDMNVAPAYTLGALEELALRPDLRIKGMLFTLKLFDWKLAEEIPMYVQRIRSWGFRSVRIRQLQFNRQEVMVAAMR